MLQEQTSGQDDHIKRAEQVHIDVVAGLVHDRAQVSRFALLGDLDVHRVHEGDQVHHTVQPIKHAKQVISLDKCDIPFRTIYENNRKASCEALRVNANHCQTE